MIDRLCVDSYQQQPHHGTVIRAEMSGRFTLLFFGG
jgi:hypothetical protein